jgi:hypothetical protein
MAAKIRKVGAYDSFAIVQASSRRRRACFVVCPWGDGKQGIHGRLLAFGVVFNPPGSPKFAAFFVNRFTVD